jgi:hypothetical protein
MLATPLDGYKTHAELRYMSVIVVVSAVLDVPIELYKMGSKSDYKSSKHNKKVGVFDALMMCQKGVSFVAMLVNC